MFSSTAMNTSEQLYYTPRMHDILVNGTTENVTSCVAFQIRNDTLADMTVTKVFLGFLYTTVFLLAVAGNSLVVYVVVSNRFMHNVTNMFIINLAIADLFVNFTSLWLTPTYSFMNRWMWGEFLCKGVPLFQGSSLFISTLTLTAIAIDRYIVILHPFRKRMSMGVCIAIIVCIWILSTMLSIPLVVNMRYTRMVDSCEPDIYYCYEKWFLHELRNVYGFVVLTFQFGIPLLLIAYCYIRIWYYLNHRPTIAAPSSDEQRKRRLLKMLVSMVVIFVLCHISLNLLNIVRDFGVTLSEFTFFFLLAHLCSMSATMWNPILYAGMNESFQREFMAVLPCFSTQTRLNRSFSMSKNSRNQTGSRTRSVLKSSYDAQSFSCMNNYSSRKAEDSTAPTTNGDNSRYVPMKLIMQNGGSVYFMGKTQSEAEINFFSDTKTADV